MKHIQLVVLIFALMISCASFAGDMVNLNTATAEELAMAIKGVGTNKAEAIVSYREEHGPYKSIEELVNVAGIGLRTVEKNRNVITVAENNSK